MTTKNPEIPPTLPPEIQQLFDRQNAGYSATADEIVKKVADAKAAAQSDDTKLLTGAPGGAAGQTIENDPTQAPTARPRRQRVRPVTPAPTSAPTQEPTPAPTLAPNPDAPRGRRPRHARMETGGEQRRTEDTQVKVARARALLDEWQSIGNSVEERRRDEFDSRLKVRLGKGVGHLPIIDTHRTVLGGVEKRARGEEAGDMPALFKHYDIDNWLAKYGALVRESRAVVEQMSSKKPGGEIRKEGRGAPISIEELEALVVPTQVRIRQASNTWSAIWSLIEESKQKAFQDELAKRLGLVRIPRIKSPVREFTEGQTEHHWKGEEARKDIERMLRFANTLDNVLSTSNAVLQEMGVHLPMTTVSDKPSDPTPAAAPAAAPDLAVAPVVASAITDAATGGPVAPERRRGDRPGVGSSLEIEKSLIRLEGNHTLSALQKGKELWYRSRDNDLYVVRPSKKSSEVFELWKPDGTLEVLHYRQLATKLFQEGVVFDGKRQQRDMDRPYREPRADAVAQSALLNPSRDASATQPNPEALARERFEQKLVQTVVAFATNLDGKLRQQGKDTTYRMSALLSHLPTVVDALIEKLKGNLVLSPAEKKAMLKLCNAAVIDSVSD